MSGVQGLRTAACWVGWKQKVVCLNRLERDTVDWVCAHVFKQLSWNASIKKQLLV